MPNRVVAEFLKSSIVKILDNFDFGVYGGQRSRFKVMLYIDELGSGVESIDTPLLVLGHVVL